jgi:hypothetical protein
MTGSIPAKVRSVADTEVSPVPPAGERHHASPQRPMTPLRRRSAALGLSMADGAVWAEVIPDADVGQPGLHRYAAVVYRGRLHRLAESVGGLPLVPFGQIEAFWAYLQRQLRAKGGIRRERLGLYLAEYAWRYNHRHVSSADRLRELLKLIRQCPNRWKQWDFPTSVEPLTSTRPSVRAALRSGPDQ